MKDDDDSRHLIVIVDGHGHPQRVFAVPAADSSDEDWQRLRAEVARGRPGWRPERWVVTASTTVREIPGKLRQAEEAEEEELAAEEAEHEARQAEAGRLN